MIVFVFVFVLVFACVCLCRASLSDLRNVVAMFIMVAENFGQIRISCCIGCPLLDW